MVNFCAVVGCSNRSSRECSKKFFRLPAIVSHQGKETRVLSDKRRAVWLSRLRRVDLKEAQYPNARICSDHFVKGQPASLYEKDDPDWRCANERMFAKQEKPTFGKREVVVTFL